MAQKTQKIILDFLVKTFFSYEAYVSVYIAYTQLKIDIFNFGPIRDSNLIPFLLGWKFFVHEFRYKTEHIYEAYVRLC